MKAAFGDSLTPGSAEETCKPKNSFTESRNESPAALVPATASVKKEIAMIAATADLVTIRDDGLWLLDIFNSSKW